MRQDTLSLPQIVKVANMFGITIQDLSLPVNLHVAAVRVLFTIVERLQHTEVSTDDDYAVRALCFNVYWFIIIVTVHCVCLSILFIYCLFILSVFGCIFFTDSPYISFAFIFTIFFEFFYF